ncbi:DUF3050 domain-containing protein [Marinilongibacter aquaticus]|uniref:DUF3050 domain-containing protein n=1 Tax=Marinilongibacter aquaticus TaxID=2975157 RepID=UPI0021BDC599|nr:DUF3050 domain-containing protein [Marinilongibacter aquaticus]UBM60248.1 DUF3050 domain-containing protein [Marinilongibacter aquaticus]
MHEIQIIEDKIENLRSRLQNHSLYSTLKELEDVRLFMEHHVFAVWDFMSLLKALQKGLTCVEVPWMPAPQAEIVRFINEIVLGEESDVNEKGEVKSHFEMYLEAMGQTGADTDVIAAFLEQLKAGKSVEEALAKMDVPQSVKEFVAFTFEVIASGKMHQIASAFTFGREDLIPDMFIEILNGAENEGKNQEKLKYYLARHIELDGDEHGPLSLKMIQSLCGSDKQKWAETEQVAIAALEKRVALWDGIAQAILERQALLA